MLAMSKWSGRAVAVLATGPSLTAEDCEAVRDADVITVGVNSAWKMAPWIDVLYAGDTRYWKHNHEDIEAAGCTAKRYSRNVTAERKYQAKRVKSALGADYNSGEMAVEMAIRFGSPFVIMLGFDVSVDAGIHFHGQHKNTSNPDARRCNRWLTQFARIPKKYPKAVVVNCSRKTALSCFPRMDLESAIARIPEFTAHGSRAA